MVTTTSCGAHAGGGIRLHDISRWPLPPRASDSRAADYVATLAPTRHVWPLMPIQHQWLVECTAKYGFDDIDETLRHLIYVANSEHSANKRLIFKIKRCLHCHVGARASQHAKVSITTQVHTFQLLWLASVTSKCDIKSIDKSVRIVCDFYQSRIKQAINEDSAEAGAKKELEIFSMRRDEDIRLTAALNTNAGNETDEKKAVGHETTLEGNHGCDLKDLANDPAACSMDETLEAINRCQVGHGSHSYAEARGETSEETERRREKERKIEESEEAQQKRKMIGKALGSVMG